MTAASRLSLCVALPVVAVPLLAGAAHAAPSAFVEGGGTLPGGRWAVSAEGGFDPPRAVGYDVRVDAGVGERVQIGASAGYGGAWWSVGVPVAVELLHRGRHHLSLRGGAWYAETDEIVTAGRMLALEPSLTWEVRWGEGATGGLYLRAGSRHFRAELDGEAYGPLFHDADAGRTVWAHAFTGGLGVQKQLGPHFAGRVELGGLARDDFEAGTMTFELGLTWAF